MTVNPENFFLPIEIPFFFFQVDMERRDQKVLLDPLANLVHQEKKVND
jgi:hypothetical protein